jgi:hypothetical protein
MRENNWQKQATNMLKAEITRRGISYDQLQKMLDQIGVEETANSINVKINRGAFSFVFFLQIMKAISAKTLRIDDE